jgi:hypothetical protein
MGTSGITLSNVSWTNSSCIFIHHTRFLHNIPQ